MACAGDDSNTSPCRESPSPGTAPLVPALRPSNEMPSGLSRCVSSPSHASACSDYTASRDSLTSDVRSRHSSDSYQSRMSDVSQTSSRQSTGSLDGRPRRRGRGYVRPQGTDFAASARSRESVLSLGSIAHLQYYFARTGLLDAQLARRRKKLQQQQQLQQLQQHNQQSSGSAPVSPALSDTPSYILLGTERDYGDILESPIDDLDASYSDDDVEEMDASILPPTVSTYNHREKPLPKPPTLAELKEQLTSALRAASNALHGAKARNTNAAKRLTKAVSVSDPNSPGNPPVNPSPGKPQDEEPPGWHEVQGMNILDVVTLAIREAKVYYTAHDQPERLTGIKPEKELRSELLSVMEVLRHMATRGFVGGMRDGEIAKIDAWIENVYDLLKRDEEAEVAERAERKTWLWARPDWAGSDMERELAFMRSMDPSGDPLPDWSPASSAESSSLPTPFLASLQSGLRLVKLHNAAVRKSRRRFGTITSFHTDTMKPYRSADNLRYWVKAAELRWEVILKMNPLGIVYNTAPEVWVEFEAAVFAWCRKVRTEISKELYDEN